MSEKTLVDVALEPKAVIPLSTLKWWRQLVDLNPADLAPRMDDQIARLELAQSNHEPGCNFRVASTAPVGIKCEHGRDVCPICDACDCAA